MIREEIRVVSTGLCIGSGADANLRRCQVTRCVNSGQELTVGSVCAGALEATVQLAQELHAGEDVELLRWTDGAGPVVVGKFTLEKPTRLGDVRYKLVAYDYVAKLDKDLSQWLASLSGWPYTLTEFAPMVCGACGVEFSPSQMPNGDMKVNRFFKAGVTGRQIMGWIGALACRYCYADAQGKICFGWYQDRGVRITPGGERFYFSGGLEYEDYQVAAIDGVKLQLGDGGGLWPEGNVDNPYVVAGNLIALAQIDEAPLEVIAGALAALPSYRPCTAEVLTGNDIQPGDVVTVQTRQAEVFQTLVMSVRYKGQRMVIECTGSARRDSTGAVNNKSPGQLAQDAVDGMSQAQIFNKLTDGGKIQGIYHRDGRWYINAQVAKIENLKANQITAGVLSSKDGDTFFDLDNGYLESRGPDGYTLRVIGGRIELLDPKGYEMVVISANKNGHGISFSAENPNHDTGMWMIGDDFYLRMRDLDTEGSVRVHKIGWKTVDGIPQMVAYD